MSSFNFTIKQLDMLPSPEKGRKLYQDTEVKGLYVRVTTTGTKSFVSYKWLNRKKVWTTHGQYPSMTIKQARTSARTTLNVISEGINPNKLKSGSLAKHDISLQKVFTDYCVSKHNVKSSTMKNYNSIFNAYLDDWKKKPIAEITRDMIEKRHRDIGKGSKKFSESPSRANTTMRLVRALFNYAMGQYEDSQGEPLFLHNPVSRITSQKLWFKEKIRQDTVMNYDLKKWYEGVMKLPFQKDNVYIDTSAEVVRDFLIFAMFSGLRRNEVLEMKWSDIDFRNHSFTLEDTKNNESHSLPLNFKLDEVLERRKNDSDNPYVFQGLKPNSHLHPPKRQMARAVELVGFHFTTHDLRRTFETMANRLNLSNYTLDKLINHKNSKTITGRYIVLEIDDLREPMEKTAELLWSEMK
ncbi:integrase family protein [Candidatus Pseudothioglobus singularis]|nr:integrase family protein [Candidatus Pseudothioglobus singularis]